MKVIQFCLDVLREEFHTSKNSLFDTPEEFTDLALHSCYLLHCKIWLKEMVHPPPSTPTLEQIGHS